MVVSIGILADHRELYLRRAIVFGFFRLVLAVFFAAILVAAPADARKRAIKRSHYAPPSAAMVVDGYTGKVLFQENADKPRFPASITKVMTLYLLMEQMHEGRLTPDTELKVSAEAANHPPSKIGLDPGDTITVHDAMYALVTKSANDVAAVVAENIAGSEEGFARMMTRKAHALGMNNTNFRNASGLPNQEQTTTAQDLVTLARRIQADFPKDSKIFGTRYFQYGDARYKNHNSLLFTYEGMDGMKTGFTQASGFNLLATVHRDDKYLIAVVLGGRSGSARNAKMRSLLNQSWRKAVAFNELKQRGQDRPAIATTESVDDDGDIMPERNPAFHATAAEQKLELALANTGIENSEQPAGVSLAEDKQATVKEDEGEEDEDEAEAQGDVEAKPNNPNAVKVVDDSGAVVASNNPAGAATKAEALGPYHIQVGSYLDAGGAKARLAEVTEKASGLLKGHGLLTVTGEVKGKSYFRARFGQFSEKEAAAACTKLKKMSITCLAVRAE